MKVKIFYHYGIYNKFQNNINREGFKRDIGTFYGTQDKNFADIDSATEKLNAAWTAASEDLYKATQEQQANANAGNSEGGNTTGGDKTADVQDVDFEEVK